MWYCQGCFICLAASQDSWMKWSRHRKQGVSYKGQSWRSAFVQSCKNYQRTFQFLEETFSNPQVSPGWTSRQSRQTKGWNIHYLAWKCRSTVLDMSCKRIWQSACTRHPGSCGNYYGLSSCATPVMLSARAPASPFALARLRVCGGLRWRNGKEKPEERKMHILQLVTKYLLSPEASPYPPTPTLPQQQQQQPAKQPEELEHYKNQCCGLGLFIIFMSFFKKDNRIVFMWA